MRTWRTRPRLACLLLVAIVSCGCSGTYAVRGRAVRGQWSDAAFVQADDQQIREGVGVDGVKVAIYRDPDTPNRVEVASGRTRRGGLIDLEFDSFGAGWMDETWEIVVTGAGYETVQARVRLPRPGSRELLVTLTAGVSVPPEEREDLWSEAERFRR